MFWLSLVPLPPAAFRQAARLSRFLGCLECTNQVSPGTALGSARPLGFLPPALGDPAGGAAFCSAGHPPAQPLQACARVLPHQFRDAARGSVGCLPLQLSQQRGLQERLLGISSLPALPAAGCRLLKRKVSVSPVAYCHPDLMTAFTTFSHVGLALLL